jgi:hypothetical protein
MRPKIVLKALATVLLFEPTAWAPQLVSKVAPDETKQVEHCRKVIVRDTPPDDA